MGSCMPDEGIITENSKEADKCAQLCHMGIANNCFSSPKKLLDRFKVVFSVFLFSLVMSFRVL